MNLFGTIHFNNLSDTTLAIVHDFEFAHPGAYKFEYSPDCAAVLVRWESFHELSALTRLAADLDVADHHSQRAPSPVL